MLKAEYSINTPLIKSEEKEAYDEIANKIKKRINNNILNKILKIK